MANKKLKYKNMKASVSAGEDLLIPYLDSMVFAEIEGEEIFVLVKSKKDPNKFVKIFFKESEEENISKHEEVEETPEQNQNDDDDK